MNIVLTYISQTCGIIPNLIYRILPTLTNLILPIIPDLDWYFTAMNNILLPIFTFIFLKNIQDKEENKESHRRYEKNKITKLITIIIPLIILILFVAGIFKYKPTAIMSNSMHPIYDRGDVVIVEKTSKTLLNNLQKYDIIEYAIDDTLVAHRIIHIDTYNDGTKRYTTKGDNNNTADTEKVDENQIIGQVKFRIPKIGYPSVWLNEFWSQKDVAVETGK
jgi:signal peptidase